MSAEGTHVDPAGVSRRRKESASLADNALRRSMSMGREHELATALQAVLQKFSCQRLPLCQL